MLKLLYIGFDGLDPDLLSPIDGFIHCRSRSPVPITGPAWTSLNTGLTVESHGLTEPWGRQAEGSTSFIDQPNRYFWNYLNQAGLSTGVMNVPITYPPKVIDGWMISGPFVPNRKNIVFPPGLIDPVAEGYYPDLINEFFETPEYCRRWLGRDRFDPLVDEPENMSDYNGPGMLKDLGIYQAFTMAKYQTYYRIKTLEKTMEYRPVDCLFYQDSYLDRLNHAFAYEAGSKRCEELYKYATDTINLLIKSYPAETTIVVSDHGGHGGEHTEHGVFAIKNSGLRGSARDLNIYDVLPTTLYAMGIFTPIQERKFDGRICYRLFNTNEDGEISRQLEGIGYKT